MYYFFSPSSVASENWICNTGHDCEKWTNEMNRWSKWKMFFTIAVDVIVNEEGGLCIYRKKRFSFWRLYSSSLHKPWSYSFSFERKQTIIRHFGQSYTLFALIQLWILWFIYLDEMEIRIRKIKYALKLFCICRNSIDTMTGC